MKPKKVLSELNAVFHEKHLVKAMAIEKYQDPHNYYPNAEFLKDRNPKDITIKDIRNYETKNGPSCSRKDPVNGEPCKLFAEQHKMKHGIVLLVKNGTTQEQLIDEVCRVIKIFEKYEIDGVSQVKEQVNG